MATDNNKLKIDTNATDATSADNKQGNTSADKQKPASLKIEEISVMILGRMGTQPVQLTSDLLIYDTATNQVPNLTNKLPLITGSIKYDEKFLFNLSTKYFHKLLEFFFDRQEFEKRCNAMTTEYNVKSREEYNKNVEKNVEIMLTLLFPTKFPVMRNFNTSYNEFIKREGPGEVSFKFAVGLDKDGSLTLGNRYSYIKLEGGEYTVTKILWLNDIFNHPVYREFINEYRDYIQKSDERYYNLLFGINTAIMKLAKRFETTEKNSFSLCDYKDVIETEVKKIKKSLTPQQTPANTTQTGNNQQATANTNQTGNTNTQTGNNQQTPANTTQPGNTTNQTGNTNTQTANANNQTTNANNQTTNANNQTTNANTQTANTNNQTGNNQSSPSTNPQQSNTTGSTITIDNKKKQYDDDIISLGDLFNDFGYGYENCVNNPNISSPQTNQPNPLTSPQNPPTSRENLFDRLARYEKKDDRQKATESLNNVTPLTEPSYIALEKELKLIKDMYKQAYNIKEVYERIKSNERSSLRLNPEFKNKLDNIVKELRKIVISIKIKENYITNDNKINTKIEGEEEDVLAELNAKYSFFMDFLKKINDLIFPNRFSTNKGLQDEIGNYASGKDTTTFSEILTEIIDVIMKNKNDTLTKIKYYDVGVTQINPTNNKLPRYEIYVSLDLVEGRMDDINAGKIKCFYKGIELGGYAQNYFSKNNKYNALFSKIFIKKADYEKDAANKNIKDAPVSTNTSAQPSSQPAQPVPTEQPAQPAPAEQPKIGGNHKYMGLEKQIVNNRIITHTRKNKNKKRKQTRKRNRKI